MSKKIIIAVIVVAIVLLGLYWYKSQLKAPALSNPGTYGTDGNNGTTGGNSAPKTTTPVTQVFTDVTKRAGYEERTRGYREANPGQ